VSIVGLSIELLGAAVIAGLLGYYRHRISWMLMTGGLLLIASAFLHAVTATGDLSHVRGGQHILTIAGLLLILTDAVRRRRQHV
jgi:hypothetical protein